MRAGTIVASNYFEMARLLGDSFLDHHPGSTFVILVVDDLDLPSEASGIETMRLADLDYADADLDRMKTIYDVMELSTAVKPNFLRRLLVDDDVAVYLDPDIYVYAAFDDVVSSAPTSGIVLTPHVLEPLPRDGLAVSERSLMQSGIFNLGFIAVGRRADDFLRWWEERLLVDAVSDVEVGLFTDQRWIDFVPALFDHEICRDPGMNIAWWNIHERELVRTDRGIEANGRPVRFIHFSGYDTGSPDVLTKHAVPAPRTEHAEGSVIRELAEAYGSALRARGHDRARRIPYQWNAADDGLSLTTPIRRTVRLGYLRGERAGCDAATVDDSVPSAFGPSSRRLAGWLTERTSDGLRRVDRALWEQRADLRAAFPDPFDADADRFAAWIRTDPGAREALGGLVEPIDAGPHDRRRDAESVTAVARSRRASLAAVGIRRRLSFLVSGPSRVEHLEEAVRSLHRQSADLAAEQTRQLGQIRASVAAALDDVVERSRHASSDER